MEYNTLVWSGTWIKSPRNGQPRRHTEALAEPDDHHFIEISEHVQVQNTCSMTVIRKQHCEVTNNLHRCDAVLWEVKQCLVLCFIKVYQRHKRDVLLAFDIWREPQSFLEVQRGHDLHCVLCYMNLMVFLNLPIPLISTSTTSPSLRNVGGFMNKPTPPGVPVMIKDPFWSVCP